MGTCHFRTNTLTEHKKPRTCKQNRTTQHFHPASTSTWKWWRYRVMVFRPSVQPRGRTSIETKSDNKAKKKVKKNQKYFAFLQLCLFVHTLLLISWNTAFCCLFASGYKKMYATMMKAAFDCKLSNGEKVKNPQTSAKGFPQNKTESYMPLYANVYMVSMFVRQQNIGIAHFWS